MLITIQIQGNPSNKSLDTSSDPFNDLTLLKRALKEVLSEVDKNFDLSDVTVSLTNGTIYREDYA